MHGEQANTPLTMAAVLFSLLHAWRCFLQPAQLTGMSPRPPPNGSFHQTSPLPPSTADATCTFTCTHWLPAGVRRVMTGCLQEWTDVASRDSAAPFLQQLVALDPTREADAAQMGGLEDSAAGEDEPAGLQLAGNGGDGMFEGAVVQLVAAMQVGCGCRVPGPLEGGMHAKEQPSLDAMRV